MTYYTLSIIYLITLSLVSVFTAFVCVMNILTINYARKLKWDNEVKDAVIRDLIKKGVK